MMCLLPYPGDTQIPVAGRPVLCLLSSRSIHARRPPPPPHPSSTPGAAPSPPCPVAAPPSASFLHARLRALAYTLGGRPSLRVLPPRPASHPRLHARRPPRFPSPHAWSRPRVGARVGDYEYETRYFRQRLDHFSFLEEEEEAFFEQRYLVGRAGGWAGPGRPIFFYCGNEGDITWFAANSGLVWDAAPRFSALVVFAEHRYYGESLPFGSKDKAYNNSKSLAYLTAEQALAENSVLLTEIKRNLSAEGNPVVLFGGSYGGILAAWMRLKFLHITVGALASSAPIL